MENYYPKKSIWKWILLYVLIGAVAYGLIYYFFFYENGNYNYNSQNYQDDYQAQTQSNETADWKTYTNEEYGFEFKYPPNYEVKEDVSNKKFLVNTLEATTSYPYLIIDFSLNDYSKALEEQQKKSPNEINNITIDNGSAREFLYHSEMGDISQIIIFLRNNQLIKIDSFKNSFLDPIITSFKFTK